MISIVQRTITAAFKLIPIQRTLSSNRAVVKINKFAFSSNDKDGKDDKKNDKKNQTQNQEKQEKNEDKTQDKNEQKKQKEPQSLKDKAQYFFNNFWQTPDPKHPQKKPPSKYEQLWKKFQYIYNNATIRLRTLFQYKFNMRTLSIGLLAAAIVYSLAPTEIQISINEFQGLMNTGGFKEIIFVEEEYILNTKVKRKRVEGVINNQTYYCYVGSFYSLMEEAVKIHDLSYKNIKRSSFDTLLRKIYVGLDVVSLIIILGSIAMSAKSGNMGSQLGIPKPKKFQVTKNVSVRFADVAGMEESKRQVQEIVDFLVNPQKYHDLGASIPKGVLLTGPPGTGKTLLAKACAGQAGVPFYTVSGSDFVEVFVGVGASRVRQLFNQAKSNSPAIIFIDQLDAIGKKRQNKLGSNDERQSTLNQLLVEMDGFGTNSSVIIMGATNRKQILDAALVRAGRFDREVEVGLPDLKGRYQILLVHLRPLTLSSKYTREEYAKRIAALSPGFSGAQLANLCNQAAILAARCSKDQVQMLDFQISSQRVIGGVERKGFVSMKEKRTVAFHECGHAVVAWMLQGADPVLKVSIIPRSKGALGFAQYFVNENALQTKQELMDRICFILGGRLSQLHFFKEVTTGAYDDLQKAYNLAYHIVAKLGMDTQIGYIAFPDVQYTKPYGSEVQSTIDHQIQKIIKECTERCKKIIEQNEKIIELLAQQLIVKETMDVRQIEKIIGKRKFKVNKTFDQYLQTSEQ